MLTSRGHPVNWYYINANKEIGLATNTHDNRRFWAERAARSTAFYVPLPYPWELAIIPDPMTAKRPC